MLKLLQRRRKGVVYAPNENSIDSTIVSLTTAVPRPPSEAINDPRALDLLPIVKLVSDYSQTLARVRSLSAGGVAAEAAIDLPVGAEVQIEFNSVHRVRGRIVWTRAEAIGIKFDESVDVRALLANRPNRDGYHPRPPRLEINCGATIKIAGYYHQVEVRDISLGGIKAELRDPDVVGHPAVVTIESLGSLKGTVRWFRDGQAGILFDKPLRFEDLAEWLGKRYELASLKAGAWTGRRYG